jgi:hypothetical protein
VLRVDSVDGALDVLASFAELITRPWLVDADWARSMIWASIEGLEHESEVAA